MKDLRSLTVDDDIAHRISPILLLLSLPIISPQLSSEMPQNGIALCQNSPIQLNDGNVGRRVHRRDASLLVVRVFFKAVARVIVGDAGIFPHQTNDLPATSGLEVEVVDNWDATYSFVANTFGAAALGGRHIEKVEIGMFENSKRCRAECTMG